ncbi:hypothetical protein ACIQUB_01055 [Rhizobium sp. NPDC090275]|uniref:hypothetical protein n=1 Tax=Rhizobium sp. NPDC090275 TaxID=3364498 RepID=UPI000DDE86A6
MQHDRFRTERIFSRWRVRPGFGEEIRSYFARLVADNADITPAIYAKNCGFNRGDRQEMLEAVFRLPLTPDEKESLVRWTPTHSRTISGQSIAVDRVSGLRRHCAECVEQAPYSRVWWSLSRFETCPFHDTLLIEEKLTGEKVRFPYFGFHPGGIVAPPPLTQRGAASFEGYVLQRLGVVEPGLCRPILDQHSLDASLSIVPLIGRFLSNPRSRETPPLRIGHVGVGFDALGSDEDHFEERLSVWIAANVDVKAFGRASQTYFGHAARLWNEKSYDAPMQQTINAVMNRACGRYGTLARAMRNKAVVGIPPNGRDVQRELGLTPYSLRVLGQRVKLDVGRSEDGVFEYTPRIIETLRGAIASLVPIQEVAASLGCTVEEANGICILMAKKGWRGAVGVRIGRKVVRHVFRADLDAFLNLLENLPASPDDIETVGIERFLRLSRKRTMTVTMAAVLSGRLAAFRGRSGGLRALLFARPPKRGYGGKPSALGKRDLPKDTMRITEFTAITGIPSAGIRHLVRLQHLSLHSSSAPLLVRSSAVAFHERYVNVARYSVLGTITVGKAAKLPKLGLKPAFEHKDIQAMVVERTALAAKLGPLREYSVEERRRWNEFRRFGERNCPSFTMPSIMGDGDMIIYTSSRKMFFRVISFPDELLVTIRIHPSDTRRAWRIYRENEDAIRRLLASFRWVEDGGYTIIQTAVKDSADIDLVTREIGELTKFFRYKMP